GGSSGEARALARRERLPEEKEPEERGHDESHLRNRHHHARFPAFEAFREEREGDDQQRRGNGRVTPRRPRRPDAAVEVSREYSRKGDGDRPLSGDERNRRRALAQAQLVGEARDSDRDGRNEHAREGGPALATGITARGAGRREQQPDRCEYEREARELGRGERLAQHQHGERHGDSEAQPEDRRMGADRARLEAPGEVVVPDNDEQARKRAPECPAIERERARDKSIQDRKRREEP